MKRTNKKKQWNNGPSAFHQNIPNHLIKMHLLKNKKTEGNEQIIHLLIKLLTKKNRSHIMLWLFWCQEEI